MADEETQLEDRVERLEAGQSSIIAKLDQLLGAGTVTHAQAEADTERRLDRPSTIKEQVAMELAKAEAEKKKQADADEEKSERQTMKEQLAKLTESKPLPPQPRRQRAMWGPR